MSVQAAPAPFIGEKCEFEGPYGMIPEGQEGRFALDTAFTSARRQYESNPAVTDMLSEIQNEAIAGATVYFDQRFRGIPTHVRLGAEHFVLKREERPYYIVRSMVSISPVRRFSDQTRLMEEEALSVIEPLPGSDQHGRLLGETHLFEGLKDNPAVRANEETVRPPSLRQWHRFAQLAGRASCRHLSSLLR